MIALWVQEEGVADFKVSENGQLLPGGALYQCLQLLYVACRSRQELLHTSLALS